jgi:GntR family transcriptional repressor for pyruvate dehydrogenase complex
MLLSTTVADGLETYIVEGRLRPGDKLPSERELGEHFAVSRTAIREAVKLLSQKGLVRASAGRGLYVAEFSGAALTGPLYSLLQLQQGRGDHILEVRALLEGLTARAAAARATADDLVALHSALEEMDQLVTEPLPFSRVNREFHLALARAAQNPLLLALIEPTMALMRHLSEPTLHVPDTAVRAQEHHRRIYDAVATSDAEAAAGAMADHVTHVERSLSRSVPNWRQLLIRAAR